MHVLVHRLRQCTSRDSNGVEGVVFEAEKLLFQQCYYVVASLEIFRRHRFQRNTRVYSNFIIN